MINFWKNASQYNFAGWFEHIFFDEDIFNLYLILKKVFLLKRQIYVSVYNGIDTFIES